MELLTLQNPKKMKKVIYKTSFILLFSAVIFSCNKKEESEELPTANNTAVEVENTERTIADLLTNYFKPKTGVVKGIVILGSGSDSQDPTPGNINEAYLIDLSNSLAAKGFVCAIVQYRDQPFVGNNFENFNSNTAMLVEDFNAVANEIREEYSMERSQVIFGGTSYSANCLVSQNAWGNNMTDIHGIAAIMGSCEIETAQNQKVPILAFACNSEPFGTIYGSSIVQNITDVNVKAKSFGLTDNSCTGHATSNQWIATITGKILVWIP